MCCAIYFGDKGKLNTLRSVSSDFYILQCFMYCFWLAGQVCAAAVCSNLKFMLVCHCSYYSEAATPENY